MHQSRHRRRYAEIRQLLPQLQQRREELIQMLLDLTDAVATEDPVDAALWSEALNLTGMLVIANPSATFEELEDAMGRMVAGLQVAVVHDLGRQFNYGVSGLITMRDRFAKLRAYGARSEARRVNDATATADGEAILRAIQEMDDATE